jgi:hypothetical protein
MPVTASHDDRNIRRHDVFCSAGPVMPGRGTWARSASISRLREGSSEPGGRPPSSSAAQRDISVEP